MAKNTKQRLVSSSMFVFMGVFQSDVSQTDAQTCSTSKTTHTNLYLFITKSLALFTLKESTSTKSMNIKQLA